MYTQLSLNLGMAEKVDVRNLIVRGEIETASSKKQAREQPKPEWERVLADGADCAFRRRLGSRSQLLVLLATQGQAYVLDEHSGARHALTAARLSTFCRDAEGDALTPPWSTRPLQDYDAKGRAAIVALMGCDDFLQMARRDMVRVEPSAASRMGSNAQWSVGGTWDGASMVWRMVEPAIGHAHAREALSAALRLTGFVGEGADEAAAECFRDRLYVSRLAEGVGRDIARDLVQGYIRKAVGHPLGSMVGFLPRAAFALNMLSREGIALEPRRACEYMLSLLDVPAMSRHGRAYNVRLWTDALELQQRVRGSVEDRYPKDPAALISELEREWEMRRHEASEEAIAGRAAELSGGTYEAGGYTIRPAASVREILDEANAQHNCVASFIDRYARGETELWLMRRSAKPDEPLVTVEVHDGRVRQAFQSRNRQITAEQRRFLADWCAEAGYTMPSGGRMRALGA